MAHEIQILKNGEACFAYNKKNGLPWHNLGQAFDGPMTVIEALKASHADYEVEARGACNLTKKQIEAILAGNAIKIDKNQIIENCVANTRTDNDYTLGLVKERYEIVQNSKAFEFIDYLATGQLGQKASIDSAGVLKNGKQVFVCAKFSEDIILPGNDLHNMYAVFTTGHDNTTPVSCMITPIRVVCNNTLNAAFGHNTGRFNFRHTRSINNKLIINELNMKRAMSCLNILDNYTKSFKSGLEQLGNIKFRSDKTAMNIVKFAFASDEMKKALDKNGYDLDKAEASTVFKNKMKLIENTLYFGVGQENLDKNTGLWLYNGITTAFQNTLKFRSEHQKFDQLLGGKAYNIANEIAMAALQVAV